MRRASIWDSSKAAHPVEWLSDGNGSAYIAKDTLDTATALGLNGVSHHRISLACAAHDIDGPSGQGEPPTKAIRNKQTKPDNGRLPSADLAARTIQNHRAARWCVVYCSIFLISRQCCGSRFLSQKIPAVTATLSRDAVMDVVVW